MRLPPLPPTAIALAALAAVASMPATSALAQGLGEPVDRVVAVVDEDPVLESEIRQVIQLGLIEELPGEEPDELRRRVLDRLIEQRVQFHEIDRFGFIELPTDQVESQFVRIRSRFGSETAFEGALAAVGLDAQGLRQLIARQLMVLIYVEERLGPRVFVGLEDIRQHYEEQLGPELRAAGRSVPPLEDVREDIRVLLREQRLNEEIDRWSAELRREADIVDYFDSDHDELPPVVKRDEG
jgi:hypothetical protein